MIDPAAYARVYGFPFPTGGQELILGEIVGALAGYKRIFVPFPTDRLVDALKAQGHRVLTDPWDAMPDADALYFGTPTIVNGRPLFPQKEGPLFWSVEHERAIVRTLCSAAAARGYKRIVSGLGTGDISLDDRTADMGGVADIVAFKDFGAFQDWVLRRDV